jgi:hypothetical protein
VWRTQFPPLKAAFSRFYPLNSRNIQKIEYRHHPYYRAEVKVVRTLRRCLEEIDIVQLPEGFQIAVPRWMLDPVTCQQLPQEAKPRVALSALLRLVGIVQKRTLLVGTDAALLDTTPPTKGNHVSKENLTVSSGAVTPAQENALEPVTRTDPGSMSSVVGSTASASGARGHLGKDQR